MTLLVELLGFVLELLGESVVAVPYYFFGKKLFGPEFKIHPERTPKWQRVLLGIVCFTVAIAIVTVIAVLCLT